MTIDDACQIMNGVPADPACGGKRFRGVAVDTRVLTPRNAFFCLRGARTDGHRFAAAAARLGAGAIIAEKARAGRLRRHLLPVIGVDDPLTALGDLAAAFRRCFPTRYIAVTGSVGKTTTKELIATALGARFKILKSPGNYNTLIGIPLTLLARNQRSKSQEPLGVLEFGMSTPGEIGRLTRIVAPEWGVVTRIGAAHLQQMGTLAAVARAKRELFTQPGLELTAFLNADDPCQRRWMAHRRHGTVTYATERAADFTADCVTVTAKGITFRVNRRHHFALPIAGAYNVGNALAAIAVARSFRIPFADIAARLKRARPVGARSRIVRLGGAVLIEDCYNANPTSMIAALDTLKCWPARGPRIAVLGAMHELGAASGKWHAKVGRATRGLDLVVTVGAAARPYHTGIPASVTVRHAADAAAAARLLKKVIGRGSVILLKASRAEALEEITKRIERTATRRADRP